MAAKRPDNPAGDEIVLIVDDENRPVGEAPRRRMRAERLPHRATYIFVLNSAGRVLVQRRTDTKDLFPGYYDLAAGGVVAAGESYEECAAREAEEELGIRDTPIAPRFDFHYADAHTRCFGRAFVCRHEGPFVLQAEEVASVRFRSREEIARGEVAPVTPDSLVAFWQLLDGGSRPDPRSGTN